MHNPALGFGFRFRDLYNISSLRRIDEAFLAYLRSEDEVAFNRLVKSRKDSNISRVEYSHLISLVSNSVEGFVIELFQISEIAAKTSDVYSNFRKIYDFKRNIVQRKILNKFRNYDFSSIKIDGLEKELIGYVDDVFSEELFVKVVGDWYLDVEKFEKELNCAELFIAWNCLVIKEMSVKDWLIFDYHKKKDYEHLIDFQTENIGDVEILKLQDSVLHYRDGFDLTDDGGKLAETLDQSNYCIYCHKQERDSCSKGLHDKDGSIKTNPLGDPLKGCPLDQKISEMNELKSSGLFIAALSVAIVDNPMLAATGHRICNDCMKSCIYQKQEPVNIPKIETRVLRDVLELPWGFEIYSLLTRWNPINVVTPYPKENTGKNVLVVGMGPAGFTLAHYLLNQGHYVTGIDGLKIDKLPQGLVDNNFIPIQDINTIYEKLEDRKQYGFGGVAEYGITVRWDKNFLTIIRILLERRSNFKLFGGIRFGSNLDWKQSFDFGFDHIALAIGAGKPSILDVPNAVALGVKAASDFLMSLQLSGASQQNSIANLQVRLPIVVIGGGLTAIDTATEAKAYYVRQVEKLYQRYKTLCAQYGRELVEENWFDIDKEIASEFFEHAQIFIKERELAAIDSRQPDFTPIIKSLGGVRVFYRRPIKESPSYRLNHEELTLALQEGIEIIENIVPKKISTDKHGYVNSLFADIDGRDVQLDVRTILVAIGTHPNVMLSKEHPEIFKLGQNGYFKFSHPEDNFSIYRDSQGRGITVFGDLHPQYKGSVVKAMASAKDGYKVIDRSLTSVQVNKDANLLNRIAEYFSARVEQVNQLADGIIEVIIHSPSAAENFQPGQFYRLQNLEQKSKLKLAMEGLALTGAWVDKEKSLISTVVLEMGGSSNLCRYLSPGEEVVLMGPTGTPTEITANENVMLVGGGLGNAVLFSIGEAFRAKGSKVLYFAGYRDQKNLFMQDNVESAADQVIWCCENSDVLPRREGDYAFRGNIVEAIESYASGKIGNKKFDIKSIDKMVVIGSDKMMGAVQAMRKSIVKALAKTHAVASINSPMQCMMKEICAQCLQKHIDPLTGIESYVYSCTNQDQDMNKVDFTHLSDRLKQNSLQEKITSKWVQHILQI
ncbi:MAG: FAD-dependent oxidoreductase [Rickettsiales bacterium]|nr:FAD-dependent oxidoreductase [Rickettsiales bacterium]